MTTMWAPPHLDSVRAAGPEAVERVAERIAELNNKLAAVIINAELLAEILGPGEERTRAVQALRGAWAAAAVADALRSELRAG
jgi:hypothetical protein